MINDSSIKLNRTLEVVKLYNSQLLDLSKEYEELRARYDRGSKVDFEQLDDIQVRAIKLSRLIRENLTTIDYLSEKLGNVDIDIEDVSNKVKYRATIFVPKITMIATAESDINISDVTIRNVGRIAWVNKKAQIKLKIMNYGVGESEEFVTDFIDVELLEIGEKVTFPHLTIKADGRLEHKGVYSARLAISIEEIGDIPIELASSLQIV